jgi:hypothetical protein
MLIRLIYSRPPKTKRGIRLMVHSSGAQPEMHISWMASIRSALSVKGHAPICLVMALVV